METRELPPGSRAVGAAEGQARIFATFCVLILAFLLASSAARNSDVWLHLATGRAWLAGDYEFGVEPFTFASSAAYWVNPSWLYEVLAYAIYQAGGGAALVVMKALAIVAMAGLLLACGRATPTSWLPEFTVSLALVCLAPWLALKPLVVSFVFLAFTFWSVERLAARKDPITGREASWFSSWPLLLVFVLWANLDSWFFLGPLTVALFCLGEVLDNGKRVPDGQMVQPTLMPTGWWRLLAASILACLINPHGVYIFQEALEQLVSDAGRVLNEDPFLRGQFFAPMRELYFSGRWYHHPAGVAFWGLAVLGLFSFGIGAWPWRWPLLWGSFFLLAVIKSLAIPFFAIVAAPILARTLGSLADRDRAKADPPAWARAASRQFPTAVFLGVTFLVIAAWPGWLQVGPRGPRQWHAELDPSMGFAAEQLDIWRKQGNLREGDRGFAFSPEVGNFLAWLSPTTKSFTNSHLHLTLEAAADFVSARATLAGVGLPGDLDGSLRTIFGRYGINHLIISAQHVRQIAAVVENRKEPLLFLRGKAAVYGWRDPDTAAARDSLADLEIDVAKAAFQSVESAPSEGSDEQARPRQWWTDFWQVEPGLSPDRDEAQLWLSYFDSWRPTFAQKNVLLSERIMLANLVGRGGVSLCGIDGLLSGLATYTDRSALFFGLDDGPPGALYLAARAARRAIRLQPSDAEAQLALGRALLRISKSTRERSWIENSPILGRIRTAQIVAALNQAVVIDPELWPAHNMLADIYSSMDYRDLALKHRRKSFEIQARIPLPSETAEQYRQRRAYLDQVLEPLAKDVSKRREQFMLLGNLRVLERAGAAGNMGLAGQALDILLAEHVSSFGAQGMDIELKLLMNTGKLWQAHNWLRPEHEAPLGTGNYFFMKGQIEAALGDLAQAEEDFGEVTKYRLLLKDPITANALLPILVGQTLLFEAQNPHGKFFCMPILVDFPNLATLSMRAAMALEIVNRQVKIDVVLGLLAAEAGQADKASRHFQRVLGFWNSPAGRDFTDPECMTGRRIATYFLEQLKTRKESPG